MVLRTNWLRVRGCERPTRLGPCSSPRLNRFMRQIWGSRIDCCSRSYRRPGAPKIRPSGHSPQTARQTKACSMRFLFNERCKSSRYITYRSKFYVLVKILIVVRLICLQLILLIGRLNLEIAKGAKDFKTDAIIIHKISTHHIYNLRIKKYLKHRLVEISFIIKQAPFL